VSTGRIVGLILILAGAAVCLLAVLFVGSGLLSEQVGLAGAVLGIGLFGLLPFLLLAGVGAYLFISGKGEEQALDEARQRERIAGLIQTQGRVPIDRIMVEMKMTQEQVKNAIYELVNQGLFSGYADWSAMTFFSADAGRVGSTTCPNCGGVRQLVGKGVVKCPYCGVELYLPPETDTEKAA
jgi:hypothetical protein